MGRHLRALSITILTFGVTTAPQEQLPQGPPPPTEFEARAEVRKPTHPLNSIACGFPPPSTIGEWWKESAGIVRVRINSHRTYDSNPEPEPMPYIHTELEVTVLDVFKLHPRAPGVGGTMAITHPGGTLERRTPFTSASPTTSRPLRSARSGSSFCIGTRTRTSSGSPRCSMAPSRLLRAGLLQCLRAVSETFGAARMQMRSRMRFEPSDRSALHELSCSVLHVSCRKGNIR